MRGTNQGRKSILIHDYSKSRGEILSEGLSGHDIDFFALYMDESFLSHISSQWDDGSREVPEIILISVPIERCDDQDIIIGYLTYFRKRLPEARIAALIWNYKNKGGPLGLKQRLGKIGVDHFFDLMVGNRPNLLSQIRKWIDKD